MQSASDQVEHVTIAAMDGTMPLVSPGVGAMIQDGVTTTVVLRRGDHVQAKGASPERVSVIPET